MSEAIDIRKLMAERGFPAAPEPHVEPDSHARFIDWPEFWAKDRSEVEWVFEDVLARGRGHSFYAKHGTGKSLFSLWMCMEVVKSGGVVVYADWEMGEDDLYERLSDMGYGPSTGMGNLRYLMLPEIPPLDTQAGARAFGAVLDEVMAAFPGRSVTAIIDTISRAVEGEENSNDTIQAFYRFTGMELKRRETTWMRLDHAGHEGTHARGASGKGDDVDVIWRLVKTDDGVELLNEKRRMGWVPERVAFKMKESPYLHYEKSAGSWPAGTHDVARALDELGVSVDAGMRAAKKALAEAGNGRRGTVVEAAQRYRRSVRKARELERGNLPEPTRETPPETLGDTLSRTTGRHQGDGWQEPHSNGAETPGRHRETPSASDEEAGGFPRRGNPAPALDDLGDDGYEFPRGPLNGGPR